jgi:CRISPR/Cas system-associated exonuclease Cas4 (RecB family)
LERKFRFDLDPPNEKFATGFIDRLFIKGDKAFIIDYKTTKRGPFRETTETVKRDLQLRCYSRVVQKEFGIEAGNIFAALYYLEGGDFIGAKYTEQSLINVEAELLNAYNQIAESNPDRVVGKIGPHCKRCEYNVICPFYRSSTPSVNWNGDMSTLKFND